MTAAEYLQFVVNRPASGIMQFKTFIQPTGGTAATWAKCSGVLQRINSGRFVDGEYLNVTIEWVKVEVA